MKTKFLLIALAIIVMSFAPKNDSPATKVDTVKPTTKVVCLNGEEVVIMDLGEEIGFYNLPIVWINDAAYQASMNYEQIRTDTRLFYQGMGRVPFYQVVDENHEVWSFNTPGGGFPGSDVEAAMEKDDTVDADGD